MAPVPAKITPQKHIPAAVTPKNTRALPGPVNKKPQGNKQAKLITSLVLVAIVVFLLSLVSSMFRGNVFRLRPVNDTRLQPTNTPIPTFPPPSPVYGQPSEYSNDPQVLQLEGAIKNFQNELNAEDLSEPEIQPPYLEKNINFK